MKKRFLSLLIMSMLGVGVFVGLKMASFDMIKSLDTYYDNDSIIDELIELGDISYLAKNVECLL